MNYRRVADLNLQIKWWSATLPKDLDLIVGVPRSGLLAANILALHLNLPLTDVAGLLEGRLFESGARRREREAQLLSGRCNILVLDDSVWRGKQFDSVKERLAPLHAQHNIRYAAVYVAPGKESHVDYYCEVLPGPRCFEWNVMHHAVLAESCVALEGVMCAPTNAGAADTEHHARQLAAAAAIAIPSVRVGWVVTCRHCKYRQVTEQWLAEHGVDYEALVMWDENGPYPPSADACARFKARYYARTQANLFVEGSRLDAASVARAAGKEVLCLQTGEMLGADLVEQGHRLVTSAPGRLYWWLRRATSRSIAAMRGRTQAEDVRRK